MAKYEINHKCGHANTVQICGPVKDRDRKEAWLASQDCPDCLNAARTAEHDAENKASAVANAEAGLPDLEGSEKQIAWAETIRVEILDSAAKRTPPKADLWAAFVAWLKGQTAASWWIDRRDRDINTQIVNEWVATSPGILAAK